MKRLNTIFIIFLLLTCTIYCSAQTEITEEEVSFNVVKWFYNHYPNAQETSWLQLNEGKEFHVTFLFEEKQYESIYSLTGKKIQEIVYLESTPINIMNELYDRFGQFKIKSVVKKTSFPSKDVIYLTKIKSKGKKEQEIAFDENETIISSLVAASNR